MGIFIKDPETDKAVRKLAKQRGVTLTEAIRSAVEDALKARKRVKRDKFMDSIKELQDRVASYPDTGLKADKAFFDWLSGEEDVR